MSRNSLTILSFSEIRKGAVHFSISLFWVPGMPRISEILLAPQRRLNAHARTRYSERKADSFSLADSKPTFEPTFT